MDAEDLSANSPEQLPSGRSEPAEWTNPIPPGRYDLVVIGDGVSAARAAREAIGLGRRRVALVARRLAGYSVRAQVWAADQALRWAAWGAWRVAGEEAHGCPPPKPRPVDFARLTPWLAEARAGITPGEAPGQLADAGIDVFLGQATFLRRDALEVGGRELLFRKAILATGARLCPATVAGAEQAGCWTAEDLLDLAELPRRLAVIGTGPRPCRWAQTFRRFGSTVHLIGRQRQILPDAEPEAASIVRAQLEKEGISLRLGCGSLAIHRTGTQRAVVVEHEGRKEKLFFDQVLLERPREPNTAGLGLEAARVAYTERGVIVGDRLATTNRRVFAAGEVCGPEFAPPEVAQAMARLGVHNALRYGRRKFSRLVIPRSTGTDPDVIRLGLTPAEATARQIEVDTYRAALSERSRAVLDRGEAGFVAVYVRRATGRVVGACVVAREAGELIGPLAVLIAQKLSLAALAHVIPSSPSHLDVLKRLADEYRRAPKPLPWAVLAESWRAWRRRRQAVGGVSDGDL